MSASRSDIRRAILRLIGPPLVRAGHLARRRSATGRVPAGESSRPLRVLLIRPDHLGDMLLAAPAAHVLGDARSKTQVDWLVGPWAAEIAQRCGGSGAVMTLEFPGFTRLSNASMIEPYRLLAREAARLRGRQYDAALILRPDHWWGAMLAAAAGIPRRFGYAVAECLPFLTDSLPLPSGRQRHAVLVNQALARLAAIRLSGEAVASAILQPCFPLDPVDQEWAATWTTEHCVPPAPKSGPAITGRTSGTPLRGPLVIIHPGSGAVLKNWPSERWADVTRGLRRTAGARVVLTGGPAERDIVGSVAAVLDPSPAVLVGATSLGQLAALFARADLVLGGDSGPLHLAAAVGTPTVRIYGPTDPVEFGPWPPSPEHVTLVAGLSCQPCRALTNPPCGAVTWPACLEAVTPADVLRAATALLTRGGAIPTANFAGEHGPAMSHVQASPHPSSG